MNSLVGSMTSFVLLEFTVSIQQDLSPCFLIRGGPSDVFISQALPCALGTTHWIRAWTKQRADPHFLVPQVDSMVRLTCEDVFCPYHSTSVFPGGGVSPLHGRTTAGHSAELPA